MVLRDKIRSRARKECIRTYALFGIYLLRLPAVLYSLWHVYSGAWERQHKARLFAFGNVDVRFRAWYGKIEESYRLRGRFGYAWDDGLGMALGPRCYNGWATYTLLGALGVRRMCALGYLLLALTATGVGVLFMGWWWALAVLICYAVSPAMICAYTHSGKPDMLWGFISLLGLSMIFSGAYVPAACLWSGLALCSLPSAVSLALYAGIFGLLRAADAGQAEIFLLCLLPGIGKIGIRLFYMCRSGYMAAIALEQAGLWKRPWRPSLYECYQAAPFIAAMLCAWHACGELLLLVVMGNALLLWWANWRILYHNDPQSIEQYCICLSTVVCLYAGSPLGLGFVFLQLFPSFMTLDLDLPASLLRKNQKTEQALAAAFPFFEPVAQGEMPAGVKDFFAAIPDNVRIVTEFDGDPRRESPLRPLWTWTDSFLPARGIDLVNEEYTRYVNRELSTQALSEIKPGGLSGEALANVLDVLGISHVIVFSRSMAVMLEKAGFVAIKHLDLGGYPDFLALLRIPGVQFHLMRNPLDTGPVSGVSRYTVRGSSLRWRGKAGQTYLIKYNYNKYFRARQAHGELAVEPYRPIPGARTLFMRVTARDDGEVMLWFRPFPAFLPDAVCERLSTK